MIYINAINLMWIWCDLGSQRSTRRQYTRWSWIPRNSWPARNARKNWRRRCPR